MQIRRSGESEILLEILPLWEIKSLIKEELMQSFILSTILKTLTIWRKQHGHFQIYVEEILYLLIKKFIKHFPSYAKCLIWTYWMIKIFLMYSGQYHTQSKGPKVDWILLLKATQLFMFLICQKVINYQSPHLLSEYLAQFQQEIRYKHNNSFSTVS